jgi:hypothetical protein
VSIVAEPSFSTLNDIEIDNRDQREPEHCRRLGVLLLVKKDRE